MLLQFRLVAQPEQEPPPSTSVSSPSWTPSLQRPAASGPAASAMAPSPAGASMAGASSWRGASMLGPSGLATVSSPQETQIKARESTKCRMGESYCCGRPVSVRTRTLLFLADFLFALAVELDPFLVAVLPHLALHVALRTRVGDAARFLGRLGCVAID